MRYAAQARTPLPQFQVPDAHLALVLRDGLPEGVWPPGQHTLPPGRVEVRLLPERSPAAGPGPGSPEPLPERHFLYLEGDLVGLLIPGRQGNSLSTWEGAGPSPRQARPRLPGGSRAGLCAFLPPLSIDLSAGSR